MIKNHSKFGVIISLVFGFILFGEASLCFKVTVKFPLAANYIDTLGNWVSDSFV